MKEKDFHNFVISCKKNVLQLSQNGGCFIGSAFSCLDILCYIYGNIVDVSKIKNKHEDRDRIILSKGHAVSGLYGIFAEIGLISKERLKNYLKTNDYLYWHPNTQIPGIEFHSGSMGHGIAVGIGMAIASKVMKKNNSVFVIIGDGELNEGSMWESLLIGSAYKLENLVVILDRNKRQANVKTEELIPLEPLIEKFSAFGWNTYSCDGHSFNEIDSVFSKILNNTQGKPHIIIANTIRGKGIEFMEDNPSFWFSNFEKEKITELENILSKNMVKE